MWRVKLIAGFIWFIVFSDSLLASEVALSNLPNPGNITNGGSSINDTDWRAMTFTTPFRTNAKIVAIELGLNCDRTSPAYLCPALAAPTPWVPSFPVDLQISLYTVQSGFPSIQIYTTLIQSVPLTGYNLTYNIPISNWLLYADTTYALVLKSSAARPLKWANVRVGGDTAIPPFESIYPTTYNGFYNYGSALTADGGATYSIASAHNAIAVSVDVFPFYGFDIKLKPIPQDRMDLIASAFSTRRGKAVSFLAYGGSVDVYPDFSVEGRSGAECKLSGSGNQRVLRIKGQKLGFCIVTAAKPGNDLYMPVTSDPIIIRLE